MTKREFNITPPMRKAIIELADAYGTFMAIRNNPLSQKFTVHYHAERLRKAQDAFGIELHPRHVLIALEQQEQKEAA